ncbi:MAG: nuclear transport factor 2 family protein [Gemmatimonadetes bacterium]|uniref:Nuclear transport factor 2 family protein n=1 Tax=Candidatus Kutchimonas denitrificans TaxID=3056748 RepID=A0AAE4ZAR4_9BACT|nr:nuclear transport factor 2 family protein [Gemmatimonadota bacterium]NIR73975.1 nuclear transport factor 2 family protein [Candidatus Kutchimonas denitrificans]NIS02964.1 nuclear transport factor 2 family protein [Gemmatimonadota bacterium]NIT68681.1 nuclear transport factor 2 family protein [Gemmatimonadota bacterium]NIU53262.1 DUF4440 domain-containing protein [Gemmatimonadota bacterium]
MTSSGLLRWLAPGLVVVSLAACPGADDEARTGPADMIAVARLMATLDRLISDEDLEELVDYIADDAVLMPPGEPAIVGKRAIADWYESLFQRFDIELTHEVLEIDVKGDFIVHRGNVSGALTARDSGDPMPFDQKYLFVIQRSQHGQLQVWRLIFNSNQP